LSVSRETKQAVLKAVDHCCHYCTEHATTVDHKVPLQAGGTDGRGNLLAACEPCNTAKGSMPYDLFFRYIRRFGKPERPRSWYKRTNWYLDKAISRILANVELERAVQIVQEKFCAGGLQLVRNKIRRAGSAHRIAIDADRLDAICDQENRETPGHHF
jgi:hypothetical protein